MVDNDFYRSNTFAIAKMSQSRRFPDVNVLAGLCARLVDASSLDRKWLRVK